jgi:hypothetical protein
MTQRWKKEIGAIAFIGSLVAIASFGVYRQADRPVATVEYEGILESLHQSQGNTGSSFSVFYVRLPDKQLITVNPPELTPFKGGAHVRIYEVTMDSGRKSYGFRGYVDAASNSTVERDARKSSARPSP